VNRIKNKNQKGDQWHRAGKKQNVNTRIKGLSGWILSTTLLVEKLSSSLWGKKKEVPKGYILQSVGRVRSTRFKGTA